MKTLSHPTRVHQGVVVFWSYTVGGKQYSCLYPTVRSACLAQGVAGYREPLWHYYGDYPWVSRVSYEYCVHEHRSVAQYQKTWSFLQVAKQGGGRVDPDTSRVKKRKSKRRYKTRIEVCLSLPKRTYVIAQCNDPMDPGMRKGAQLPYFCRYDRWVLRKTPKSWKNHRKTQYRTYTSMDDSGGSSM